MTPWYSRIGGAVSLAGLTAVVTTLAACGPVGLL